MTIFHLIWLFFVYSFLGWVLETAVAAVRKHRYIDRSLLLGPFCIIYGITGIILTLGLRELTGNWFFLFLGSVLCATVAEWIAGHLLERISGTRWWDYSRRRWNLDGYICVSASLFWGLMGLVAAQWGSPLVLGLYDMLPPFLGQILIFVLLGLLVVDVLGTVATLAGTLHKMPAVEAASGRIRAVAVRMGHWIFKRTEGRIVKAHPDAQFVHEKKKEKSIVFAAGCSFYKIVLLFVIGAFLGDLIETVFCRFTVGIWMSRSSVVWGPFSVVWGLGIAMLTLLLYQYKDRGTCFLFWAGTLLGGAYEYLCSVFTEWAFGTVFWDYSHMPFNLGGRINLLYCFFWGFAAILWFRGVYPYLSAWIEKIPKRLGICVTWVLIVFMVCNMGVSCLALARAQTRAAEEPADAPWEVYMDAHYDDARLDLIYPNATATG